MSKKRDAHAANGAVPRGRKSSVPRKNTQAHRPFEGVHCDEAEGGTGHDPHTRPPPAPHYWAHHAHPHHPFNGVHVDETEGGTGHAPNSHAQPQPDSPMQQPAVEDDDGTPVKEGELGEAVAKELGAYFQSEEGAGAFKLALRNFLMGALAQHGLQDKQHHRQRPRGRRHHRVVRCTAQADPA